MARNALGRELPATFDGKVVVPYRDPWSVRPTGDRATRALKRVDPGQSKVCQNLQEAIERCGLRDGMTIATHHHLRNGDFLLNHVVRMIDHMGLKDITIASSSVHPVHAELIPLIREGVVGRLECGVNGLIGELCSKGELRCPITVRSHGGRVRSIVTGQVPIDVAFIAAPCCDEYGNMSGALGPSAFGSLGYAHTDAEYARHVIAVTDNLVPFPATPISIGQASVDWVVRMERLGDPKKIVSTTTRVTTDPVGLQIARYATQVIEASGYLRDGFAFQTGSGGTSLAVAENVRNLMRRQKIKGSFGCGGITGYFVDMLEEGLFQALFDVQCFDLNAVESIRRNRNHLEISADTYANPFNSGAVVNKLDVVILGATEVDVDFNVNANTESNGYLLHNTGGHSDTAAGAKLAIIVAPSMRGRLPIVRDAVTTITTPGATVGAVVTERGIAVNDRYPELKAELLRRQAPVKDIRQLQREIQAVTGAPRPLEFEDEVVALIEYRDGTIIDAVRRVRG
ncbi:MAG: citrate lyase subunit alpha [Anaeromyxobacter sp.]|nr:citrate lyase subunit alpha [Anaeromyxobacter sp.]MBL0275531.1 citrate lyase subunit alpha [Anaeromyxobacter sp.]